MNLFGAKKQVDPAQEARDEASRESISRGGLPLNAIDRLTEQKARNDSGKPFFTSDLSVNELLLTHQCGFEPLGQVMGTCVYQIGWQYLPTNYWGMGSSELEMLSGSQMDARNRAFSRLRQEAKLLGGDGVVGVRFEWQESEQGSQMIEFKAVGTAVRKKGAPPLAPGHEPFVSNLNGQDHWALRQAGFAPLGFVFGSCAWFQYPDWRSQSAMMSWSNAELTSVTHGLYTAREIAMARLTSETRMLHAEGVVGVDFHTKFEMIEVQSQSSNTAARGFLMHCTAWGTAIGRDPESYQRNEVVPFVSLQG